MIVLPGPIVLANPLPAGWRRPDPAPWRDPAEVAVTVERLAPVAAEPRGGAAFMAAIDAAREAGVFRDLPDGCLDCGEAECVCHLPHVLDLQDIADTWAEQWRSLVEADPSALTPGGMRRRAAMLAIAAHVRGEQSARAERIEAAARALLVTDATIDALGGADDIDEAALDEAYQDRTDAFAALRAALCSCTGHGPDLACVEHGEALRAWQKRHAP